MKKKRTKYKKQKIECVEEDNKKIYNNETIVKKIHVQNSEEKTREIKQKISFFVNIFSKNEIHLDLSLILMIINSKQEEEKKC